MITVYKYTIEVAGGQQDVVVPVCSRLLKIGMQNGKIALWFEVETEMAYEETKTFSVFGTGQSIPEHVCYIYIDTVFDGDFVWHVYQVDHSSRIVKRVFRMEADDHAELLRSGKWRKRS